MKYTEEIMNVMNEINYGWVDKDGNSHTKLQDMINLYLLQTPEELIENKVGLCWDQVELERKLFEEKGIKAHAYFIVYLDNKKFPCHTFLSFEDNNKFYYFEHAWNEHKGIKEFNSEKELLNEVKKYFIGIELKDGYIDENIFVFEYSKPNKKLNTLEFYDWCQKGIKKDF